MCANGLADHHLLTADPAYCTAPASCTLLLAPVAPAWPPYPLSLMTASTILQPARTLLGAAPPGVSCSELAPSCLQLRHLPLFPLTSVSPLRWVPSACTWLLLPHILLQLLSPLPAPSSCVSLPVQVSFAANTPRKHVCQGHSQLDAAKWPVTGHSPPSLGPPVLFSCFLTVSLLQTPLPLLCILQPGGR